MNFCKINIKNPGGTHPCADQEGCGPHPPPPENYKNVEFLSNTGPDALNNTKLSMLGHHWPASKLCNYGDLCKHLGIDSSTDHPDRYSNLFLNAYINRHAHTEYLKMIEVYSPLGI